MNDKQSIIVNRVPFVWDHDTSDLTFFGISSVLFWANPSLYRMLAPLVDEIGVDLFRLLVAQSSSIGTDEDYHAMVTVLGSTFEEGFLAWGHAVSAAGWGTFELPHFDVESCTARIRVKNPWELRMQKDQASRWGCPFLKGKVIGLLRHALGRPCWAEEQVSLDGDMPSVTFRVYASDKTLDLELQQLRQRRCLAEQTRLGEQVEAATAAILEKNLELERKNEIIRSLSTPILQVWDGVLVVPLAGNLPAERAAMLNADLLARVVSETATQVILDLTGLGAIDDAVADRLGATVAALRLIGTECAIVGLAPSLAKSIATLGVSLGDVRVLRTLADALRDVVGLARRERKVMRGR